MELVYDIFDLYMAEKDKYFMFYIVIALILTKEQVALYSPSILLNYLANNKALRIG